MMVEIQNLEIHVSHSCNLACQQCTHYSNFKHKGMLSIEDADREMGLWSDRIKPKYFSLLGGEPALNPDLCDLILLTKKHWPNSQLQLISNGFLLHKHPNLPSVLERTGTNLEISVHHDSKEYMERLQPSIDAISFWEMEYDVKVNFRPSSEKWTRTYLGEGKTMLPFNDGDPEKSWSWCRAKWCPQIYEGKLWKCPQLAYLSKQLKKVGLSDSEDWKPYLEYKPLDPSCTYEELKEFVSRKVEPYCNMCSASPQLFKLESPLRNKPKVYNLDS